jgi:hypothetical protein
MLYPLSYRRKARVVYRGEAGVATGVGDTCFMQAQLNRVGGLRIMLPSASGWI